MAIISEKSSSSSPEQQQKDAAKKDDDVPIIDLSQVSTDWQKPEKRSQDVGSTEILWRVPEAAKNDCEDVAVVANDQCSTVDIGRGMHTRYTLFTTGQSQSNVRIISHSIGR